MVDDEPRLMLLVADDASQIRQINALAGRAGWRMRTVPDGETALRMLDDTSPEKPQALMLDSWIAGDESCRLIGRFAVGVVDAHHIHTGFEHPPQRSGIVGRGAEGGDYLGAAAHEGLADQVGAQHTRPL